MAPMGQRPRLTRFAWLSIAAAVSTMALKSAAYLLTGSVGLLSDALESGVNLAAAILTLIVLTVVARPPMKSTPTDTRRPSTSRVVPRDPSS